MRVIESKETFQEMLKIRFVTIFSNHNINQYGTLDRIRNS